MGCCTDSICQPVKAMPAGTETLTIGQVETIGVNCLVWFKPTTLDRPQSFPVTASSIGLISVDLTAVENYFSPGLLYECWITRADKDKDDRLKIFIAGAEYTCLLVPVTFEYNTTDYTLQLSGDYTTLWIVTGKPAFIQ